ncbi:acyl-CoA dehydrogenase family protein [Marinobacter vinifirmus]|uniref:Acyl-CoA dehydrogenase n=1 Tax=Marinobacter vinifirmus TaxID=355591 RepID=A0A558B2E7_9GAMM|nr:acyl-CoA dehydrogenase [Marinobacter vinifirmus]TVT30686.1 MAG: acyl-CoA dehydrogenase [Marinobacter vinifirmus]
MTDFQIPEDIHAVIDSLLRFIEREVLPIEREHGSILDDERDRYQRDGRLVPEALVLRRRVRNLSYEAGFYTMFGAEELGGGGLGATAAAYVHEAMNRRFGPGHSLVKEIVIPSAFTNGLSPVLRFLSPALRERYLIDIARGDKTLCFGLSEPDAGSDVFNMKTRAVLEGDEWILNGTKQWITNAPYADYGMIFAVTDPDRFKARKGGVTGFFIDTRGEGFKVTSTIPLMGHLGADIGIVSLENVRVPADHVLGTVHEGFDVAMSGVGTGRLGMAGSCVGLAEWALDRGLDYAKQRVTFGKPIREHQAIQMHLAECAMDIYAAKNMVLNCAWRVDAGHKPTKELSMCKAFATEMLFRVMDRIISVHGAMGLTNELQLEEGLRLARILRVPDGTGEIQRRTIARKLLAGDTDF